MHMQAVTNDHNIHLNQTLHVNRLNFHEVHLNSVPMPYKISAGMLHYIAS